MATENIIKTLTSKRDGIERTIATYQKRIEEARRDLSHVNATIRLFETGRTEEGARYVDTLRLFKRGEIWGLCKAALEKEGPLDSRELAVRLIQHRGLDIEDTVLRKSLTLRVVQALRMQQKRGKVQMVEKRKGRILWRIICQDSH
jgi:hypothetical protein